MRRLCHNFAVHRVALALVLVAVAAGRARADEVEEILVEGNTKTTSDTVELIAGVDTGDDWQPEMVDIIKQRLVSCGLFNDVDVFWEPTPKTPGGVKLHIKVADKHSWVVAPSFYDQPTQKGGGVGYGENNLFGLNQKLLLYAQITTGDSFFVGAWVLPSLGGTRFYSQIDTFLRDTHNIEYAQPTKYLEDPIAVRSSKMIYLNGGFKLGINIMRGVKLDARIRAAKVSYNTVRLCSTDGAATSDPNCVHGHSATVDDIVPGGDPTLIPSYKPGKEGWDVSNEFQFTIDRRANWYGVHTGHSLNFSYEWANQSLGSDYTYHRFGVAASQAWQVLERHNFVLRGSFNLGHHLPFQQELLTGGSSMRGWINNQFRGDLQVQGTAEYSAPLFTIYGLGVRGLAFWDTAYTAFVEQGSQEDRFYLPNSAFDCGMCSKFAGFKNSVGVGGRLLLQQIVIPLLGLDVGYGLEAHDVQVYLAIGLTD
jgi:outer membrane protein assembly factor BamA